ncbi:MAG: hypothetical protein OHK93_003478 [Ramalina farinacea]|uniref:Uncharacterized protein n=1 Tax=Ramalina farinacea TaxID=258253 RepID=A0AA43QVV5_9LECA|nr:hypothetical protein [Ramalina farinacea]
MSVKESATAFAQSYAAAMHLGQQASTTPESCGEALANHYLPTFTAYVMGTQTQIVADTRIAGVTDHLQKFQKHGLGMDVRLKALRVEVVSELGSALCWITWEVFPKNGQSGWAWENCYGYRKTQDKEGFEFSVSDNEIALLAQHCPGFFED